MNPQHQRGGTFLGFILGLVVGLGVALAVAMYVTKVPTPFSSKSPSRSTEQDAAENEKNKAWNPNSVFQPRAPASTPIPANETAAEPAATTASAPFKPTAPTPPAPSAPAVNADPLGDLMKSKTAPPAAAAEDELFQYFIQVGAYRTVEEAHAQKARIAMMGLEARVSEREQAGRTIYRVRLGPYDSKKAAEALRNKLETAQIDNTLVRVQR